MDLERIKQHYRENIEHMVGTTEQDFINYVNVGIEIYKIDIKENSIMYKDKDVTIDVLASVGQDTEELRMGANEGMATRYTLERDYINEEVDPEWFLEDDNQDKLFTLEEWTDKGIKLFGTKRAEWKFICPSCGRIQSADDFVKLGFDCVDSFVLASHDCYGVHNVGCGCAFKLDGEEVNKDLIEVVTGDVSDKLFPFWMGNAEDELTVGLEA